MIQQLLFDGLLPHLAKTCATIALKMVVGQGQHPLGKQSPGAPHVLTETPRSKIIFFRLLGPPQLETTGFTCRLREPLSGLEKMKQFGFGRGHGKPENEWELFQKII